MNLEDELLQYFRVDFDLLEPYGFVKNGDSWFYRAPIMNGQFEAEFEISASGRLKGRVIDKEMEEDYILFRSPDRSSFASEVRESYLEVLKEIVIGCYKAMPFRSDQGNMINDYVYREYGDIPDNPFTKTKDYMVIRNHNNRKWYGLIGSVARNKLTGTADEPVEVLNVKVAPENLEELLQREGIYPAFHMNKKNWISVILDGTVRDELIQLLLDESYSFTESTASPDLSASDWLVPANPAYYDVLGTFERDGSIRWPMRKKMQPGDSVYIYYSAPYSCIVLRADVISVEADRLTLLQLAEIYPLERYPLKALKQAGLKTVRFVNRIPYSVKKYLEEN